ncbi:hypothetical protein [Kitasatospora phosalacinea]|uniref:Uncharacterized protein n=1 Tax=Kitasatospora phosalacinea TaxID=2065 RepID=A0ABW6GIH9_9ACTN
MPRDETSAQRAARLRLGRLPGYVRQPDPARRGGEDGRTYKKGWEVRFTARSEAEITEIRELVAAAGFAPARPFFKGHQLIQPVYGIAAVQAYLAARESLEAAETAPRTETRAEVRVEARTEARVEVRTDPRSAGIPEQTRREPDSVAAAARAAESAAALAAATARATVEARAAAEAAVEAAAEAAARAGREDRAGGASRTGGAARER